MFLNDYIIRLKYEKSQIVVWIFLKMSRVCLQFVIVVFPDHTYLLFVYLMYPIVNILNR